MKKRTLTIGNLLLALAGFLFFVSFSVTLVLNLRCIYYFDIDYLDLESETGYSEEVIRRNYDALIDYNLVTKGVDELVFPDFPMSENAATHFKEVKQIFVSLQYLCVISGVIFLAGFFRRIFHKKETRGTLKWRYGSLKWLSLFTILVPIVLGVCVILNWDAFFIQFHQLFFNNDYWLFDPATDPVILILPDEFFAHCAVAILLFLILEGILTGVLYRFLTKSKKAARADRNGKAKHK